MQPISSYFRPKVIEQPRSSSVQDEHFSIPDGLPVLRSHRSLSLNPSPQIACHFFRLPYEIREQIYLLAFGDRITLHIDLQYRHAYFPGGGHANIRWNASPQGDKFDHTTPKQWRWWSCVCHRPQFLSGICCAQGEGSCCDLPNSRPPRDPSACFIGVSGWLKSCRQAYIEILPILYSTNTFYISSMPLLQKLTSAISPTALSLLTSLKLNLELWPEESLHQLQGLKEVNRVKRFSMYGHILSQFTPANFPRLKKLSIEFTSDWHSDGWDLFTQSVANVVPGKPERTYLLQPTDQIIEAFEGNLDLEVMLKPEHAFVVAHKLGLSNDVIRGIQPDGKSQYWKVWRDLPVPGKEQKAAWPQRGYWLFWDPYFQVPAGFVREEPGPWCQFTNGQGPWSWWTDEHGFVYGRTILELKLDWGVGMMGAGSNAAAAATAAAVGRDRRVWFPDVERDWLPMRWLLERAL